MRKMKNANDALALDSLLRVGTEVGKRKWLFGKTDARRINLFFGNRTRDYIRELLPLLVLCELNQSRKSAIR